MWSLLKRRNFISGFSRNYGTKIGFIGVGNMGSRMAQNLLKKNESLIIYDTQAQNLEPFENRPNAKIAGSVKELADESNCVITMLPNNDSVLSVYTENDGILNNCGQKNAIFIDCSTIDPGVSQKLFSLCEQKNFSFLDAPVSGGVVGAENASLTFMVGGCELTTKVIEPLLLKMGSKVTYCGAPGSGQVVKLCNNLLLSSSMIAVAESMNIGLKFGLDAKLLASVINSSSGRCWSSDTYNPVPGVFDNVPASHNYQGGFKTTFLLKDVKLALDLAERTNSSTPLAKITQEIYLKAASKGYEDSDFSVIYKYLSENVED
ncbi:3-hydroxyisobutyrate dehydrogenase, mitochondrial [Planococcus citri]|uniref:3-hydroxyisobutyrate dehydrogenase, mitochondrial n=1 Tax=Planococcus citri TaxID=170843 RepID=UPI0031F9C36A